MPEKEAVKTTKATKTKRELKVIAPYYDKELKKMLYPDEVITVNEERAKLLIELKLAR